jgi:hypothetical protein
MQDQHHVVFGGGADTVTMRHGCPVNCSGTDHKIDVHARVRSFNVDFSFDVSNAYDSLAPFIQDLTKMNEFQAFSSDYETIEQDFLIHASMNKTGHVEYAFHMVYPSAENQFDLRVLVRNDQTFLPILIRQAVGLANELGHRKHF